MKRWIILLSLSLLLNGSTYTSYGDEEEIYLSDFEGETIENLFYYEDVLYIRLTNGTEIEAWLPEYEITIKK